MNLEELPHSVIRACLQVHAILGPGLTRDAYEECLAIELRNLEITYKRRQALHFLYRGQTVVSGILLDFIIDDAVIVRVMASEQVSELDRKSMETWLKISGLKTGLIVNFQVPVLRKGIHRISLKRRETGA